MIIKFIWLKNICVLTNYWLMNWWSDSHDAEKSLGEEGWLMLNAFSFVVHAHVFPEGNMISLATEIDVFRSHWNLELMGIACTFFHGWVCSNNCSFKIWTSSPLSAPSWLVLSIESDLGGWQLEWVKSMLECVLNGGEKWHF